MLCGYGVGDHRLFVVDVTLNSLIGETPRKVVHPAACRLNTRLPHVLKSCNATLKTPFKCHCILEKMELIARNKLLSQRKMKAAFNRLEMKSAMYTRAAEKRC